MTQLMDELPHEQVKLFSPFPPFFGIDFAVPLLYKDDKHTKTIK